MLLSFYETPKATGRAGNPARSLTPPLHENNRIHSLIEVTLNDPIETFSELGRHTEEDLKRRCDFSGLDF